MARFQGMAVAYGNSILGDFHLAQEAFIAAYVRQAKALEEQAVALLEQALARFLVSDMARTGHRRGTHFASVAATA